MYELFEGLSENVLDDEGLSILQLDGSSHLLFTLVMHGVTQEYFIYLEIDCVGAAFFRDTIYYMTIAQLLMRPRSTGARLFSTTEGRNTPFDKGVQHLERVGSFVAHLLNKVNDVLMMEALVVYPEFKGPGIDPGCFKYRFKMVHF